MVKVQEGAWKGSAGAEPSVRRLVEPEVPAQDLADDRGLAAATSMGGDAERLLNVTVDQERLANEVAASIDRGRSAAVSSGRRIVRGSLVRHARDRSRVVVVQRWRFIQTALYNGGSGEGIAE